MPLKVVCLTNEKQRRYREVAEAMSIGIGRCGDIPYLRSVNAKFMHGIDCAISYGWKRRSSYVGYRNYVYADLGFWHRQTHYRFSVNAWSPHAYVHQGQASHRLRALGLDVKPWRKSGRDIIIAGASAKSMIEHGVGYMEWERLAAEALADSGFRLVYRPKPTDRQKRPLPGIAYDERPIEEALRTAHALVTHHSNAAVDALVAGVPVHCETGVGAAFSVPMATIPDPELLPGREQFLSDTAWLQWSLDDMRSGAAWSWIKERNLLC